MSNAIYYIFRSSELYLGPDGQLPRALPSGLASLAVDEIGLELAGSPARVVLLRDVDPAGAATPGGRWVRLRAIFASEDPALAALASPAARALGLVNWHNQTRYCPTCGSPLADSPAEVARVCAPCDRTIFPRISPAIIVLVRKGDRILLARHTHRNQDIYACIAGFLEHGESLEDCVRREVREEVGIEIANVRYAGSQSWPFPDQHMVAFYADWASGELIPDPAEIDEARWFDPKNLPNTPAPGTVAWKLINHAFDGTFGT